VKGSAHTEVGKHIIDFFNSNTSVPTFSTKHNKFVQLNYYTIALREMERPKEMAVKIQWLETLMFLICRMITCLLHV